VRRSEVFSAIYILKLQDFFEEGRVNKENTIVYQYDIVGNRIERRSRKGEEKYEYNERNQ